MNAPLRLQAAANERCPLAHKVDPGYLRGEPDDSAMPFDGDWADAWIHALANAEAATDFFDRSGIDLGDNARDIAALLQEMAVCYRDKPGAFGDLIGGRYFQTMKALASVAYANQ